MSYPYSGGSRRNIRLPHESEKAPTPVPATESSDKEDSEESEKKPFDRGEYSRSRSRTSSPRAVAVSGDVTGFMLGLVFWAWVALPFLRSGTTGVKDTWRAKFVNKGPNGAWLP